MRVVKFGEHFQAWTEADIGTEIILQYGFGTRIKSKIVAVPNLITLNHLKDGRVIGQSVVGNGELIIGPEAEIGQILAQLEYALPKIETQKMLADKQQEDLT
jgi:hypothetical protein